MYDNGRGVFRKSYIITENQNYHTGSVPFSDVGRIWQVL